MPKSIKEGDFVYDRILQVEGSIGHVYNNFWELLAANNLLEEDLRYMGMVFTTEEKKNEEFYILYTQEGNDVSCSSRIIFKKRINLNKMI